MRKTSALLIFLVLLLSACQRDEGMDTEIRTPILNPATNPITGSIVGNVYEADVDFVPVDNAVVWLGALSTETDAEGNFSFDQVRLYENGSLLRIEKDGYFVGTRRFNAFKDEIHNVEVQLIRREESGNFQTTSGGEAVLGAATLDLPPGNYISANGTYTGDMRIFGKWLDPTDKSSHSAFPGNLSGINKDDELKTLASFGIMIIEIEDTNGQELQLPEGSTATLTMPIPEIMHQYAQSTLELWSYDETNATWVEEGTASRDGDFYIAEVSHLAYWSINISFDEVTLSSQINIDGFPAVDREVKIVAPESGFISYSQTSSEGRLSLSIPEGEVLNLTIEGDCINTPFESTLEPQYETGSQEAAIELHSRSDDFSILGKALTCAGEALNQGWIRIQYENDNEMLRTDANGSYDIERSKCVNEPFSIYAIDPANGTISLPEQVTGAYDAVIADLVSCENINYTQELEYTHMNWGTQWRETVEHVWEWSFIDGLDLTILNVTIKDDVATYMTGAIRFVGDISQSALDADYLFTFPTQGFELRGTGAVSATDSNNLVAYQFTGTQSQDPTILDNTTYPAEGITDLTFDLVYFD